MTPPLKRGGAPIKRAGKPAHRGTAPVTTLVITTTVLDPMEATVAIPLPGLPIVTANGGFTTYVFELLSAPVWMTINSPGSIGRIVGTPPAGSEGDISVTVKVTTPSNGATDTKVITGSIAAFNPAMTITTTGISGLVATQAITTPGKPVQTSNGVGPFKWEKVSGDSWLSVDTAVTGSTGRLLGTPPAAGTANIRVKVTDSQGETYEKDITGTIAAAPAGLSVTTDSLGDMVEGTAIALPGFLIQSSGGTGTHVWNKTAGPTWMTLAASSTNQVRVVGTPPTGSAGTKTLKVTVTANGVTSPEATLTGTVTADDTSTFQGYYDKRVGFTKNMATKDQVADFIDLILSGTGDDRIVGGLTRWDMGGTANGAIDGNDEAILDMLRTKGTGVWAAPILGYTAKEHQRRLHFDGEINAASQLLWKKAGGGYKVGDGILAQLGDAGRTINSVAHPARRPSAANNYYKGPNVLDGWNEGTGWYGPASGQELSIHGPGIPVIFGHPITITADSNIIGFTKPTGDNEGANCPDSAWVGQQVSASNVPGGATISAILAGNQARLALPANTRVSATGSRTAIIGFPGGPKPMSIASQIADGFTVSNPGKMTIGASGTYYIGGTNAGLDQKMWYDDPLDFQTVCYNITRAVNVPVKRAKRFEVWNEMYWGMGSRPLNDIARAAILICHAYVGIKLADPTAIVCVPSSGHVGDNPSSPNYKIFPQWLSSPFAADSLLNFWYNVDPTYFSDLLTANGLTKARAPKIPGDEWAIHPYGSNPTGPTHEGMSQLAEVFNMIGSYSGGVYLPMAPTEQGLAWTKGATTTNPNATILSAALSYTQYRNWFRMMWGTIPWTNNTLLHGPGTGTELPDGDGTGGTITVAAREAKMKKVISCATMFALRDPANASGEYGLTFDSRGAQKYVLGENDAVHAFRTL